MTANSRRIPAPRGWRAVTPDEVRRSLDPSGHLAYLAPMFSQVAASALKYVVENPTGDEVALAVLDELDRAAVETAAGNRRNARRLIADCEDLTLAALASLVGSRFVFCGPTRPKSRFAGFTRPRAWADACRAIRVALPAKTPARLLLDTSVARKVIQDDADAIDLSRLQKSKGDHRVSLTTLTALELNRQLVEGRILFEKWKARRVLLADILDPESPILPGEPTEFAPVSPPSFYREGWRLMCTAQSLDSLMAGLEYVDEKGETYLVALDPRATASVSNFGDRYLAGFDRILRSGERPEIEDLLASTRFFLEILTNRPACDLPLRASARRALEVIQAGAHSPDRKNDAIDGAQLQFVEAGILCTQDGGLKRRADASGAFDAWRVMLPNELLTWLESDLIPFGPDS
jgi:hypothetical protein